MPFCHTHIGDIDNPVEVSDFAEKSPYLMVTAFNFDFNRDFGKKFFRNLGLGRKSKKLSLILSQ
jgi:hypothetical protein